MQPERFFQQGKRFFFDSRDSVADYVREHCRQELDHILDVANDVAAGAFLFDLRWDMERTWEAVRFAGEIDWLHQPGDDAEWIFQMNRMRYWICLGQAYAVTGDETYAQAFARQLCHWVKTVRRDDPRCEKAWRTIETGIRMENWLKAMCYFEGSPAITPEVMDTFIGSVTEHAEFILSVFDSYHLMSNWGVLANHGLYLAGVMLPSTPRTALYADTALERLEKEMRIQVYPDGVQWEQSPMYHNEVMRCFLDVVLLAQRNGKALPQAIREGTRRMLYASLTAQKPDGHELCMGDSDDIDQRDLMTIGAAVYRDGTLKSAGYAKPDFDSVWELGMEDTKAYEALDTEFPSEPCSALWDSGNFYLRSGWDADAFYAHFHCGTLGAGHGHSDQLHIDVFCRGEDILLDPGRYTYVNKPERFAFKDSDAHNTCTVDGENFYACSDSWGCSKLCRAVNQKFRDCGSYAYTEGGHLGYAHNGVFVNRRVIYLKPDLLVLCDEFYTGSDHTYTQHLHWGDAGQVRADGSRCRWQSGKNDVQLVQLSASPLTSRLEPGQLSRHYNRAQPGIVLRTELSGCGFTSLFTVLACAPAGEAPELRVEKRPVRSNFKGIVFADSSIEALRIEWGERRYTLAVAHEEYASPTDTFCVDGCTGFGSVNVFDNAAGETEIGTVLLY